MMYAKGVVIKNIQRFVKETQGEEGYNKWMETLSPEAREVYSGTILISEWYPYREISNIPSEQAYTMFFDDKLKGAWESGRFNANNSLSGVYKIFVRVASPEFILNKAGTILPTFYKPSAMEIVEKSGTKVVLRITEFSGINDITEYGICGWMERALEVCKCKNIKIEVTKSLTKGDPYTEIVSSWER